MLLVGRVTKAHGLRGEVVVDLLSTEPEERLAPGAVLSTDRGPLVVGRPARTRSKWLVRFDGRRSAASPPTPCAAPSCTASRIDDPDALWVHELVGAVVVDADGTDRGTVVAVLANPADDLLELDGGALVPLGFVVERDAEGRIVVDPPDGLFDLGD